MEQPVAFEVVAPYLLPELLSVAAEKLPRFHVHTSEVDLADLAEGVADGTFELGIGYDLVDDPRLPWTSISTSAAAGRDPAFDKDC